MTKKISIFFAPIHYVLDSKNSGSEFSWAYNIYRFISRYGHIQSFFVTGGTRGIHNSSVYRTNSFDPGKLNLTLPNIIKFYFAYLFVGFTVSRKKNIDIIHHVLPFYISHSFNLLPFLLRKPFIIGPVQSQLTVTDIDLDPSDARGIEVKKSIMKYKFEDILLNIIKLPLAFLSFYTLKRANKVIVINKYTKNILVKKGIMENKISIIPPGININAISYVKKAVDKPVIDIVTVSYLLKRKGIDLIIKALSRVIKEGKNIRLHIVGDGPQRKSLQMLVDELNLEKYVIFHGFINQSKISNYYAKADIFVSMSRSESWGQMYLEAMASGLPIISSKNTGSESIIKDGIFGYLVNQEDYKDLAKKITRFIKNPYLINEFGIKARKEAEKKYDWEKVIIPQYIKLYEGFNSSNINR